MLVHNVYIPGKEGLNHIHIQGKKISSVFQEENKMPVNEPGIDCGSALAFPGLINSHDHLEFNLYPQLANGIYTNYTDWGNDIHKNNKDIIGNVLKIPLSLRTQWGVYKNLLNGVTTVVNHGEKLEVGNELITVLQDCYSLHSPAFEKNWKWKLNSFLKKSEPVVMHIGEGSDEQAVKEIDELVRWNFFNRRIIAVHGVMMNTSQARHFKALVWCPASNIFLLGQTARVDKLHSATKILFGTDSTLTASWNAWEHFRLGRNLNLLSDKELFEAITKQASDVWNLNAGELSNNKYADIVVAKRKDNNEWNSFFAIDPADILLVIHKGKLKLVDDSFYDQVTKTGIELSGFSEVQVSGCSKWVPGDLRELANEIKKYFPGVLFPISF